MSTGFSYDERYLRHLTGAGHPECPQRLTATLEHLRRQQWFDRLQAVDSRIAESRWIRTVHSDDYVQRARETCAAGAPLLDTADVSICPDSYSTALLAAGSALELADGVVSGQLDNGFLLARPPGHHAEHDMAMGFCLFNNVAILARYLQAQHGVGKILILDWDVHHGNGTQHTFEDDPSVLYISTHQYPFYPGTGAYYEEGTGAGKGATLNCPMPAGSTDADYKQVFRDRIIPRIDRFAPEFILISAGFDAHRDDPLAQICLTTECFEWMTLRLLEAADKHSGGRIVSLLEGGYNLHELPRCVATHVATLGRFTEVHS